MHTLKKKVMSILCIYLFFFISIIPYTSEIKYLPKLSIPTKLFHPKISTPDQHYRSFGQN
jgi:hypothetical protein